MGTLLRHGSEDQKERYLPAIARGDLRLQAFGVTEPDAGLDTTQIRTMARRDGRPIRRHRPEDLDVRAEHSDLMLLLARTLRADDEHGRWYGLSTFIVDLREAPADRLRIVPIETMLNHSTTEVFFDGLEVPAGNRVGEEGMGFRYILDGMNAERILLAAECVGDGRWFLDAPSATRERGSSSAARSARTRAWPSRSPGPSLGSRRPTSCAATPPTVRARREVRA